MRSALYIFGLMLVVITAFWSYRTTYATQDGYDAIAKLRRDISREREAIAVLNAEWAYLNAPARLEELTALHRAELGLGPLTPDHFAMLAEVAEPPPDDGMEPVAIIDLDDVAAGVVDAPPPRPRPARLARLAVR